MGSKCRGTRGGWDVWHRHALLPAGWSTTPGVIACWCQHVCGEGTACSGKQGRGTAHPSTPFTVRRPYVSGNVRIRIAIEDGKLLLVPVRGLFVCSNVWICLTITAGTGPRKDQKAGWDGHRKTNGLVPNIPQLQYWNGWNKVMNKIWCLNICKVRFSKLLLFLFTRYSPYTYYSCNCLWFYADATHLNTYRNYVQQRLGKYNAFPIGA